MSDDEAARKAISELDGGMVEGRAIKVAEARPREDRPSNNNKRSFDRNKSFSRY